MSRMTKVSSYRSGEMRFGGKPAEWDRSVSEYKLTPDEIKRYLSGESMESILSSKGEHSMNMTKEEYFNYKEQGLSDAKIAKEKGIHPPQLSEWKRDNLTPEEIEQTKLKPTHGAGNKPQKKLLHSSEFEEQTIATPTNSLPDDYRRLKEEHDALQQENENLKREVIDAHKLVTEKEQTIVDQQVKMAEQNHLFDEVMVDKRNLHKENILLENEVHSLQEEVKKLNEQNSSLFDQNFSLSKQLKGLGMYSYEKLRQDMQGV
ncbi:hypothetical protein [Pseudobacillus badius]|uniref:hypothetical protein n=1 Tax=Bacillus badius TaxID=1455 RepID=UPI0024A42ADE|nr:hypothetical protein [Bacillus badius]GLY09578.1 hypothetical protein Bbad01_07940 [Bacillus badius]